jgi:threonine dehydrogenase-like Zn-dependent dehydrogenase
MLACMRATVMRNRRLVVDDLPEPEPGPGQVLVKTLACGICGSDLHMLRFADRMMEIQKRTAGGFVMDLDRDVVMGHEFCAEILDYGPDSMRQHPVGTRVCSMPVVFGGFGIATVGYSNDFPGGYGERMVLNEMLLLPVPPELPTEIAATTEPMAVGMHAVEKAGPIADDVPLVLGCGPVGLAVIAALRLKEARPIIAADFSPKRRELALKMGADIVVDPAEVSPYRRWEDVAVPEGVDPTSPLTLMGIGPQVRPGLIFECVGVAGVLQQVLEGAPRRARVVVVGVCMESDRIEPILGINKELSLQFVLGYTPEEFAATLEHLAARRIDTTPLLTGRVGVDGIGAAFEALGRPETHAKILAEPWRQGGL